MVLMCEWYAELFHKLYWKIWILKIKKLFDKNVKILHFKLVLYSFPYILDKGWNSKLSEKKIFVFVNKSIQSIFTDISIFLKITFIHEGWKWFCL